MAMVGRLEKTGEGGWRVVYDSWVVVYMGGGYCRSCKRGSTCV